MSARPSAAMRWLAMAIVLALAASIATYARYESLNPCDWLERDMARAMDLPALVVRARIRAAFLLRGIAAPGPARCLTEWWTFKADGVPAE